MSPWSLESLPRFEGPARSQPFVLAGDRAAVVGDEASGIREILLPPVRAVSGLQMGLPSAKRVELSPGAARRHLEGAETSLLESTLVFHRLPGVVVRWSRESGGSGSGPLQLSLAWECPGTEAPLAGTDATEEGLLRLPLSDGPEELLFVLLGGTGRWHVQARDTGDRSRVRVGLRAFLTDRRPLALVATLVREGGTEADTVLSRLDRLETEVEAWAGAARRDEEEGLALDAPDASLGPALAWARRRLAGSLVHPAGRRPGRVVSGYGVDCPRGARSGAGAAEHPPSGHPPSAPLHEIPWIGYGLLAAGRHDAALDTVTRGLERLAGGFGAQSSGEAALPLHLAAQYVLWTGDAGPLHRSRDEIDLALERIRVRLDGEADLSERITAAAALRDLADAVEAGGDPERANELRPLAESLRERLESEWPETGSSAPVPPPGAGGASGGGTTLRLPVLPGTVSPSPGAASSSGSPDLPDPEVLAAVLGIPGPEIATGPGAGGRGGDLEAGLRAWAGWKRGRPAAALEGWRDLLVTGVEKRRALWGRQPPAARPGSSSGRAASPCPWHAATTALAVAPLVFGLLGARADAAYGRLRLAPRVPAGWDSFTVRGLRVGDVRVRLSYRREKQRHTFVLAPTAGRIPLNVAFEPLLSVDRVHRVLVDGEEADVDIDRQRHRIGIRLQLPLDSRREITVDEADRQD